MNLLSLFLQANPVGSMSNPIGELVDIIMWIARCLLLLVGGGFGLVMLAKGKTDEDPKKMGEGILSLVGAGVMFAATFAVASVFK